MEAYANNLKQLTLGDKGNKDKKRLLDPGEVSQYRGGVGSLNWLQGQAVLLLLAWCCRCSASCLAVPWVALSNLTLPLTRPSGTQMP